MIPHSIHETIRPSLATNFRPCRPVLSALGVLLLACGVAVAGVTAGISGTVRDSTGAVLVGASVTVTNVATGIV